MKREELFRKQEMNFTKKKWSSNFCSQQRTEPSVRESNSHLAILYNFSSISNLKYSENRRWLFANKWPFPISMFIAKFGTLSAEVWLTLGHFYTKFLNLKSFQNEIRLFPRKINGYPSSVSNSNIRNPQSASLTHTGQCLDHFFSL